MNPHTRRARARVTALFVITALAAGSGGGYWWARHYASAASPAGAGGAAASGEVAADPDPLYTCGMHPQVIQKGPGECPICHMKLTPLKKTAAAGETSAAEAAHTIRIDPVTIQNMGIRTTIVQRGPLVKTIRTVGRVDYDEQLVTFVNTKFDGWIERLFVDETGQRVEKGQPLFEVYSRELYAAQEEYAAALRSLPRLAESTFAPAREEAARLVDAAATKLRYLDVSDAQIARMRDTGQIEKTLVIYSPAQGIVTEKAALEGLYVSTGSRLYTLADVSRVWVFVDVHEYQLPWVRIGQAATMSLPYVLGKAFVGKVVYIYPYLEQQTRVIRVRLEFENPALELKPGMYANVTLESEIDRHAVLVPREAYIDSGMRKVAFVDRGGGKFEPRDLKVGVETESGLVEVLAGLAEGEVVVTSGQFLLDAESKLREAVAKMMEPERVASGPPSPAPRPPAAGAEAGRPSAPAALVIPPDARYACVMEECRYFASEPGRCPVCGMELKPLESVPWAQAARTSQPMPEAGHFVCPMHAEPFHASQPGTCPVCGMQLVAESSVPRPERAPERVAVQMNFIMEHYLELHQRLSTDRTADIALHALGLASAAEELAKHLADSDVKLPAEVSTAAEALRQSALQTTGRSLESDRVAFVEISAAVRKLVAQVRPDRHRWPKLYIFHCPMTKGDWLQATEDKANPYYGFKMLKCGDRVSVE